VETVTFAALLHPVLAATLAPLLPGVINRVKAFFAGRTGPPLLQPYRDIARLLRKGAVFSTTTTGLFRVAPAAGLAIALVAVTLLPAGGHPALLPFPGDFMLLVGLLALGRFILILAALDTGSSFEGMGASREAAFAALSEPALLLGLAAAARVSGESSLTGMMAAAGAGAWSTAGPALLLVLGSLLAVLLTENARIPVDDPNTHLELTMIHEVMVLDHSGPDLALIEYGAALRLWLFGALILGLATPFRTGIPPLDAAIFLAGMLALAGFVGAIESAIARLRLLRVPQFLVGAIAFSVLALVLVLG
jgi:formate hydrogenlyase subunit 4